MSPVRPPVRSVVSPLVSPGIIQAYRETDYQVYGVSGESPFTLHVNEASAALAAAHKRHQVSSSAYVTACNPFSEILDVGANARRHAALRRALDRQHFVYVEGFGQHKSSQWPLEPSFLVFGLTLKAAKALGTCLKQNAILWAGVDAVPQLILLR